MDTSRYGIEELFLQLGLPSNETAIEAFISNHHLPKDIPLEQVAFWSAGQAQFIHEAVDDEADWAEIVDQLDAQLRH
jgi:hypothetical protein